MYKNFAPEDLDELDSELASTDISGLAGLVEALLRSLSIAEDTQRTVIMAYAGREVPLGVEAWVKRNGEARAYASAALAEIERLKKTGVSGVSATLPLFTFNALTFWRKSRLEAETLTDSLSAEAAYKRTALRTNEPVRAPVFLPSLARAMDYQKTIYNLGRAGGRTPCEKQNGHALELKGRLLLGARENAGDIAVR